jgi:VCBS repeat-containing protein
MKIVKEFENKLLKRKEVELTTEVEGTTLSRSDAKKQAVKALKADEKLVVVHSIKSHFGTRTVTVKVYVYEDEAILKKLTSSHILKRNEEPAQEEAAE